MNQTTDGWGRELDYKISERGDLTLLSLGRDGMSGGEGDDADIRRSYRTRAGDGRGRSLIMEPYWIATCEIDAEHE